MFLKLYIIDHTPRQLSQTTQGNKMNCPQCNIAIDINSKESSHQVNDNNEETYCSYECSAVGTLRFFEILLDETEVPTLSRSEILNIIENT